MSSVRLGVFGVAVLALVAGCASTGDPMPPAPAGLEKFYAQTVHWGDCAGFSDGSTRFAPATECARVAVPIDYAAPDGPTAQIAVSRLRATGKKIGSLLMNPGGPGEAGLAMSALGGRTPLAERFDRVGFDPRGVGASTPAILCQTAQENDAERTEPPKDNTPQGIADIEAENKRYADRCVQRSGLNFLAHVGTKEVAQDMDVLRAVLGDPKLTYLGYSYGTRLGSAYAEKFPTRVRAMVLDGAIDPTQDPVAESLRQAAGFQTAFNAYSADCVKRADCPLGTDPAAATARFRELLNPLWDKRVPTSDQRGLGYDDAITGVRQALYSDELWPGLTLGLAELRDGRGDTLLRFADMYQARRDDGTYSNRIDAFNAIRCVDDPRVTDRAVVARQDADARRAAPFADDGRGTGASALELCATWPVPNTTVPHHVSAPGLPKTVVVSTTEDPATPYQAGVDLAGQLGASLITYKGSRHTVALVAGEQCVDSAVFDYLVSLKAPAPNLTCGS
ncbi:alpha/beta hydrolase [Nocardia arthritidis]|uniref:Alpha/beta fold hydrolase n=1 Tax=Nocardia arthritidis TaxID=228602 RepID=A0A6G9YCP3_9NOCA|nr:alpha/beta hydrolase [Nocardia arthritidis]QIS10826.1 alpha/beta fold hydrolase [Nocardia arthritidis]